MRSNIVRSFMCIEVLAGEYTSQYGAFACRIALLLVLVCNVYSLTPSRINTPIYTECNNHMATCLQIHVQSVMCTYGCKVCSLTFRPCPCRQWFKYGHIQMCHMLPRVQHDVDKRVVPCRPTCRPLVDHLTGTRANTLTM